MQPNLLIVLSDQLRRDALGIYGNPDIQTPHIDRLAQDGVRFDNACSSYPICVPFRFTFMTGMYAHSRFVPGIEWRMSPAETTLADAFNTEGYHTVYVGKWHLYGGHAHLPNHPARKANMTPVPRQHQGRWQKWLGFEVANNPFDTYYFEDDDPTPRRIDGYQTDGLFDIAMTYLESIKDDEKPFCCVLSVEPPHFPLEAPERNVSRLSERALTLPPNHLYQDSRPSPAKKVSADDLEKLLAQRRMYYAMIENLDDNIGRLVDFLREQRLADHTLLALFADHGEMGGMHRMVTALKEASFEEAIGIPLIVYDPRHPERGGTRLSDVVCTEDLFPTLCGLAEFEPKQRVWGKDLAPLIRGEVEQLDRDGVLLEMVRDFRPDAAFYKRAHRGIRTRRWKYTVLYDEDDPEHPRPWQLFDLENDPLEDRNLVDNPGSAETRQGLHAQLQQIMLDTDDILALPDLTSLEKDT